MNAPTISTADALIAAALAADEPHDLVWWAQDELGLDADALLVSDNAILNRCTTVVDFIKARRTGCLIRISRRGRLALWILHRLLPAYRRGRRATAGTSANRFAPDFSSSLGTHLA